MSSRPLFMYYHVRDAQGTRVHGGIPIDDDFVVSRLLHVCWEGPGRDLTGGPARPPLSSGRTCTTSEVCRCQFTTLTGGTYAIRDVSFMGICTPPCHVPLEQPNGGKEE